MKISVSEKAAGAIRIEGVFEKELGQTELLGKKIVAGLGERKKFNLEAIRTAVASAVAKAREIKAKSVSSEMLGKDVNDMSVSDATQAMAEAAVLSDYDYQEFKKDKKLSPIKEFIILEKNKAAKTAASIGEILASAQNEARNLVNGPSNKITPTYLANFAKKIKGVKCSIVDPKRTGMESLWAIAKGSKEPPKVVVLKYQGTRRKSTRAQGHIALIGKGITFDSGGISIKPSSRLWEMKMDMAGAAAVLLAMKAIAKLKIKKNIIAVIPLCENMPDGGALKPGDVVSSLDGTTIEIISTDAEGRMILADAITYAKKLGAKTIFDCATLTGGCVTALGDVASGLLGNDQDLINQIKKAAEKTGEKAWQLPLYEEYVDYLKSSIADIKNCMDKGMASASTGATFLHKFVGDTPWVHLDIAGTAHLNKKRGVFSPGATGVPLRTIVEWLRY